MGVCFAGVFMAAKSLKAPTLLEGGADRPQLVEELLVGLVEVRAEEVTHRLLFGHNEQRELREANETARARAALGIGDHLQRHRQAEPQRAPRDEEADRLRQRARAKV